MSRSKQNILHLNTCSCTNTLTWTLQASFIVNLRKRYAKRNSAISSLLILELVSVLDLPPEQMRMFMQPFPHNSDQATVSLPRSSSESFQVQGLSLSSSRLLSQLLSPQEMLLLAELIPKEIMQRPWAGFYMASTIMYFRQAEKFCTSQD